MNANGSAIDPGRISAAEVVLPCAELGPTLAFFTERLGFRVAAIFRADAPATAVIVGHGLRLRLQQGAAGAPGHLRLLGDATGELVAPNGTRIELAPADPPIVVPPLQPRFVLTRGVAEAVWGTGRAGMQYRDLIPDRLGGRFIASHIRISEGGPVPDYVHFHKVRFQMIYCRAGWVRVVYQDQGPDFIMRAGDCVLQPPRIRHRVLECSAGLEVIEVGCPALHETLADAEMTLPTARVDPARDFGGQRFVRHVAAEARWWPWRCPGFACRDTGIAAATAGLAGARVVRPQGTTRTPSLSHGGELMFLFVLDGGLTLQAEGTHRLAAGDCCTIPAGLPHALDACTADLQLLEVTLPGDLPNS